MTSTDNYLSLRGSMLLKLRSQREVSMNLSYSLRLTLGEVNSYMHNSNWLKNLQPWESGPWQ